MRLILSFKFDGEDTGFVLCELGHAPARSGTGVAIEERAGQRVGKRGFQARANASSTVCEIGDTVGFEGGLRRWFQRDGDFAFLLELCEHGVKVAPEDLARGIFVDEVEDDDIVFSDSVEYLRAVQLVAEMVGDRCPDPAFNLLERVAGLHVRYSNDLVADPALDAGCTKIGR